MESSMLQVSAYKDNRPEKKDKWDNGLVVTLAYNTKNI